MIAFSGAGVFDDDIGSQLSHDLLSFDFLQTVPAVGVFGIYQVEHTDNVSVILQIPGHVLIEFTFGVIDNETFSAQDALEDDISGIGPAFHRTAGSVDSYIPVHPCLFRQADGFAVPFAKNGSPAGAYIGDQLQNLVHFLICHKARCAVGSFI